MRIYGSFIFVLLLLTSAILKSQNDSIVVDNISIADLSNEFIDSRDNQKYTYIIIDEVKWMAENLRFDMPNSLIYSDMVENLDVYGRLYNWEEAICACPTGWRLPSDDDWKKLESYIGIGNSMTDSIGWRGKPYGNLLKGKLDEFGKNSLQMNTAEIGFNALAGGVAYEDNQFANYKVAAYFWSSTNYYSSFAWSRYLSSEQSGVFRNISLVNWYLSVRCIENE